MRLSSATSTLTKQGGTAQTHNEPITRAMTKMAYGFIKLEWQVPAGGFTLENYAASASDGGSILTGERSSGTYLVPCGSETTSYTADLLEHCIFLELANMPPRSQAVLEFANKWGLPTRGDWTVDRFIQLSLAFARTAILADAKGIPALARKFPPDKRFGSIKWGFGRMPRQSAPGICFYARDLLTFCWLELLQFCVGPTEIRQCEICKDLMQRPKAGPMGEYCSQACRQKAYRLRMKAAEASSGDLGTGKNASTAPTKRR